MPDVFLMQTSISTHMPTHMSAYMSTHICGSTHLCLCAVLPKASEYSVETFRCVHVADGSMVMHADEDIICWTGIHMGLVSLFYCSPGR